MKKLLLLIIVATLTIISPIISSAQEPKLIPSQTSQQTLTVLEKPQKSIASQIATQKRKKTKKLKPLKKTKQPKTPKAKKQPKTIQQLAVELTKIESTGDQVIDKFVSQAVAMALRFHELSQEYQNIKIEVKEVEDAGDGVTTAVLITDNEGNPRTKEIVLQSNLNTVANCIMLTAEAVSLAMTGTTIVTQIVADPIRALSLLFAIKQLKLAVEALSALGREIPIFTEQVKTQNEMLAQAKNI